MHAGLLHIAFILVGALIQNDLYMACHMHMAWPTNPGKESSSLIGEQQARPHGSNRSRRPVPRNKSGASAKLRTKSPHTCDGARLCACHDPRVNLEFFYMQENLARLNMGARNQTGTLTGHSFQGRFCAEWQPTSSSCGGTFGMMLERIELSFEGPLCSETLI